MNFKMYLDVLRFKIKGVFSRRIAFSSLIFGSRIHPRAAIKQKSRFYGSSIEKFSYVGRNCLVQNTAIGKFVSVADNCNLGLPSHALTYVSTSPVFTVGKNVLHKNFAALDHKEDPVLTIGNDVWIGAGVSVKAGLSIGDGAVIGAGSVVTHDVPPYEIWAGNPARLIRKRFDDETIQKLLDLKWWEWEDKNIQKYALHFNSLKIFSRR